MEDIVEEPIVDIDGCDLKNPLAVVEYVEDLYAYYRRMEGFSCVPPNYLEQQFDINEKMRAILIDWLIEVHDKFELLKETLFLTVNLIDRFLSKQTVVRKKLQLVGLVAMLLACKYEEVSVPVVGDLILISDKAYTRKEVLEMENLMLNTLQFNMSVPTPYVFMKRFLKAAQSDKKLDFKIHDENKSLYNTPPCYGIYMCGLVFEDLLEQGGLGEIEKKNKRKADLLYNAIDESKGYKEEFNEVNEVGLNEVGLNLGCNIYLD